MSAFIRCTIPQGQHQTGDGDPVLTVVEFADTRAPDDTSKKDDEEVLVGEGVIKLRDIKIQYHKKNEIVHRFVFTSLRYCRRSPLGL